MKYRGDKQGKILYYFVNFFFPENSFYPTILSSCSANYQNMKGTDESVQSWLYATNSFSGRTDVVLSWFSILIKDF